MSKRYLGIKNLQLKMVLLFFLIMSVSSICAFLITAGIMPIDPNIDILLVAEAKRSIKLYNSLTMLFAIILATLIVTITVKNLLKPIRALKVATKRVAQGDFNIELPIIGNKQDELNILTDSFNKMSKELAAMHMLHSDFINNVSHEFKTPIASIQGFATVLQNSGLTDEQKEYVSIITDEAARLSRLTTNILKLTKLENQVIVTDKQYFSLDEQIRRVILLLQNEWMNKKIDLNLELSPVTYFGNEELLQQVWLNLIGNAIKFTNICGEIIVTCYEENDRIITAVTDNGKGMSEHTIKHIFDKFYQGDKSHTGDGNGLGLPLVKRIVELCGGSIEVKSIVACGSSFIVTLPKSMGDHHTIGKKAELKRR